jgi:uncharacterized protein YydD (DUF2326 family)
MLRLTKLYSEPRLFEPIEFRSGINIIVGEKSDPTTVRGRKTNGVGKSLSVEFIDFCLLADTRNSRVMRIPRDKLPDDFAVLLDLQVGDKNVTIRRSTEKPDSPEFIAEGKSTTFRNIDDASRYLGDLLFSGDSSSLTRPSFRQLLAPLIRDEKSEFKEIGGYFDTSLRVPMDFTVPLFFLGIDLHPYDQAKRKVKEIKDQSTYLQALRKSLTQDKKRSLSEIQSEINALSDEVRKISIGIESLKSNETFELVEHDLVQIENRMESLRERRKAITYELKRLSTFARVDEIKDDELVFLYNDFKLGLGDMISRSLGQVRAFKAKIEEFQNSLVADRVHALQEEKSGLNKSLRWLESEHTEKVQLLDNRGVLADVKTSLAVYHKKSQELSRLNSQYQDFQDGSRKRKLLEAERGQLIVELDNLLSEASTRIGSLRETILEIHERLMGNKEASFQVETANSVKSAQVIQLVLRIYDDGSHSVDRSKVFIFDMALLFDKHTSQRHPRLLIHDNIFDVDQDTLVQSLNFLDSQESQETDFQYVLTLNRDKIENEERQKLISLDIESHKIATFTKDKPFLEFHYQELRRLEDQVDVSTSPEG